jgi:D-lactate dehydrogenase (cytochrome)
MLILFSPDDEQERRRAERLAGAVAECTIARDGVCASEHGIGIHKLALLALQHGDCLPAMRAVKRAFDPDRIMKPGKAAPW